MDNFMNLPTDRNGQAYVQPDSNGTLWIRCPWCGNKLFIVRKTTKIVDLPYKCKSSKCKREMEINFSAE